MIFVDFSHVEMSNITYIYNKFIYDHLWGKLRINNIEALITTKEIQEGEKCTLSSVLDKNVTTF